MPFSEIEVTVFLFSLHRNRSYCLFILVAPKSFLEMPIDNVPPLALGPVRNRMHSITWTNANKWLRHTCVTRHNHQWISLTSATQTPKAICILTFEPMYCIAFVLIHFVWNHWCEYEISNDHISHHRTCWYPTNNLVAMASACPAMAKLASRIRSRVYMESTIGSLAWSRRLTMELHY